MLIISVFTHITPHMSRAGTKTTTSGLEWNTMLGLTHRLKQDGNLTFYLLILSGC
jgi:hypothetical protein